MTVRVMTSSDVDWAVDLLAERRRPLVRFAPVFWRPAPDARERHREHLAWLVTDGGALAYRTDDALLVATRAGDGWEVDDAVVPDPAWGTSGMRLWEALRADAAEDAVRLVCPVPERPRTLFARVVGLRHAHSWWHREVDPEGTSEDAWTPHVDGATASQVQAPSVYAPGGPVLFLSSVQDHEALVRSVDVAAQHACPVVVAEQPTEDDGLAAALRAGGFRQHAELWTGTL